MSLLQYRAGSEALTSLRARGLSPSELSALVLPAIGPKWLVLSGFDRALIDAGFFDAHPRRLLLFGASVGAWRALTFAARDPRRAHAALLDEYCNQRFTAHDSPAAISGAYQKLLERVAGSADLAYAVRHPRLDLAIATARARGPFAAERASIQALALSAAALANVVHPPASGWGLSRWVFASEGAAERYPLLSEGGGVRGVLSERNLRAVALASGSVPLYMAPVLDPPDAEPGLYLDGGFSDYHLNRSADAGPGISLLLSHQRRIVPVWFDKLLPWRVLTANTARLLQVYPRADFVRSLPGGAIPTRDDFKRFEHEPEARITRWREVAARSDELAAELMADVTSGAIAGKAEPLLR